MIFEINGREIISKAIRIFNKTCNLKLLHSEQAVQEFLEEQSGEIMISSKKIYAIPQI